MATHRERTLSFKDFYQVLHLQPDVDSEMIDHAYWHLARVYSAAPATTAKERSQMDDLNEAYSVLRSPALRQSYDRIRASMLGVGAPPTPPAPPEALPPPLPVMRRAPRPKLRVEPAPAPHWSGRLVAKTKRALTQASTLRARVHVPKVGLPKPAAAGGPAPIPLSFITRRANRGAPRVAQANIPAVAPSPPTDAVKLPSDGALSA